MGKRKNKIVKLMLIVAALALPSAFVISSEKAGVKAFADLNGLHGTVTSITRFGPFDLSDAVTNAERDLAFDYIEVTTDSKVRMKLVHRGASDYQLGEDVCLLFKPTNYGSFLLGDFLEQDDPARKALPLSKIRVEASGFVFDLPKGACILCSDEKDVVYVAMTGSGDGACERWRDDEGVRRIRIEDDDKNSAEAGEHGCGDTKGAANCFQIVYREY